ncbi:MAG TPA: hypothetical protein PLL33_14670 [Paracoccus sp. (in: a-proteobacteria)]|nr:hypothetical protein [Paracoccus sp. (in: a-proteobacteria)]
MIWNEDVLFIHVPKTGGMSTTSVLETSLPGQVFSAVPAGHEGDAPNVTYVPGTRHERIHEAARILERYGRRLDDFKVIIAGMRNPYDLEVSRFHHIKMHFFDQPLRNVELIKAEGFEGFCAKSNFYGCNPPAIHQYYTNKWEPLPQLRIVRHENMAADMTDALAPHVESLPEFPHLNASRRATWQEMMTPTAEAAIHERFKWLFTSGYYDRYSPAEWSGAAAET